MRRSRGVLLPPLPADPVRRRDLYRALRSAILDGTLAAGDRLPSSRAAAADYGVSRGTIDEVFSQLTEEGFLERAVGRGTFVAESVGRLSLPPARRATTLPASRRGVSIAANAACREPDPPRPFNAGMADTSEFPWKTWQRLQTRALRELGDTAFSFADPRGLFALRAAIARYLAQFRGFRCTPQQVVVFNSAQQAVHALAILLLDRGDSAWIEDPCYLGARAALELAGANLTPIAVDEHGLRVDEGLRCAPRARLAYVTPPHQYPSGVALSFERRVALLEWARKNKSWIIEDDYDGEFRYGGPPLTALYALDAESRVVYVGTLNKTMFVSLRLAFVVVPEDLVESLANVRTQMDGFTPALSQMATSLFMDEGHFSSHLRRARTAYAAKRAALVSGLHPLASRGWTWPNNPVGMHLMVRHPRGDVVRRIAARSSLDLALLSTYRKSRKRDDGLFLRFGGLTAASLQAAIEQLVTEVR
jgi:GntR family transcriptional regulator / MocR family aminotransferase